MGGVFALLDLRMGRGRDGMRAPCRVSFGLVTAAEEREEEEDGPRWMKFVWAALEKKSFSINLRQRRSTRLGLAKVPSVNVPAGALRIVSDMAV